MIWTVVSCWLCAPAGDPLAVGQGPEPWDRDPSRAMGPASSCRCCQVLVQLWAKRLTQSGSPQEDQILPQPFN